VARVTKYPAINLGPLCVDLINAVLGTELEPWNVWLSAKAHEHMATDHADDYVTCLASLPVVILAPTLIGEAPKRTGNFELHLRVNHPTGKVVMAAVSLEANAQGNYQVRSSYLVEGATVDNRRLAKRLRPPPVPK
jgi:hypothetical protein